MASAATSAVTTAANQLAAAAAAAEFSLDRLLPLPCRVQIRQRRVALQRTRAAAAAAAEFWAFSLHAAAGRGGSGPINALRVNALH